MSAVAARRLAWGAAALLALLPAALPGQPTSPNKPVPEADRAGSLPRNTRGRPAGLPREMGEILEVTDLARQTGLGSVRHVRRVSNALYDCLTHLRIAMAENDRADIERDRQDCQLLFDLVQQVNPSAVLGNAVRTLRQEIGRGARGDPESAFLRLQLDIEKHRQLYPLQDLDAMSATVLKLAREGRTAECDQGLDMLLAAVALPNVDGPAQRSFEAFQLGLAAYEDGKGGDARRLVKDAAGYISHLSVGTYLAEASWYLAKSDNALRNGLGALAVASLRDADTVLNAAGERAWKEFRPQIETVRGDSRRLLETLEGKLKKGTLTTADVRGLAKRIEAELRIPS